MVKVIDIRNKTQRTNGTRPLSKITHISRHHSATTDGDFFAFWRTWNGVKKWGTGGYHEIILRDGSVQLCYDPEEITNGVGNHNSYTYHICVVGNGSFTAAQEAAFEERCKLAMERFNIPVERVLGHKEFKGANTACPGIDMNVVRNRLKKSMSEVNTASVTKGTFRIKTGTFSNARALANAIDQIKKDFGFKVYESADSINFNPKYRINTGTFSTKEAAEEVRKQFNDKYGWVTYLVDETN